MLKKFGARALGILLGGLLLGPLAWAQNYPNRPITLVVPWGAGGGTDAVARIIGALLEKDLGQPVNVVNRTGGNGVVGHSAIATAAPDGYVRHFRAVALHHQPRSDAGARDREDRQFFSGMWHLLKIYHCPLLRGSALGTVIGIQPGSGADMASWMSYSMSKKFSKEPEKFGTGHVEGIVESGAANNSSLAGAWIPAIVFGIPGDSITAIAIGVLYLKNMNPGPMIFVNHPENIYAIFLVFILANLIMVPLGWLTVKVATRILKVARNILMPTILLFCFVGSFAINNSVWGVVLILFFGVLAFLMEENGFPVAPAILGVVLGTMMEENFVTSMIKSDGDPWVFFTRPIAMWLAAATLLILFWPVLAWTLRALRRPRP